MEEQKSVSAVCCLADANDTHAGGTTAPRESITQAEAEQVAEEWRREGLEVWENVAIGRGGKFGKRCLLGMRREKMKDGKSCMVTVHSLLLTKRRRRR